MIVIANTDTIILIATGNLVGPDTGQCGSGGAKAVHGHAGHRAPEAQGAY